MEKKRDNRKTGFPGFLRYRGNNLTGREKNSFERELQKDPFAAEAEEGLSELSADELHKDLSLLSKRLNTRTRGSGKIMIYGIAATVAVLMTISTLYLLLYKSPAKQFIQNAEQIASVPADDEQKRIVPAEEKEGKNEALTARENIIRQPEKPPDNLSVSKKVKLESPSRDSLQELRPNVPTFPSEIEKDLRVADVPQSRSLVIQSKMREIRGTVISSDDKTPVPGASVTLKGTSISTTTDVSGSFSLSIPEKTNSTLLATFIGMEKKEVQVKEDTVLNISLNPSVSGLSEVVVTGYGTRKRPAKDLTDQEGEYTLTEPVSGKAGFDEYIRNNIHEPVEFKPGEKAVVVLSFIVRSAGDIDSIIVIRSPAKPFSDEAIRLLKEGPVWKPATDEGKPVDSRARVRIVFK